MLLTHTKKVFQIKSTFTAEKIAETNENKEQ